MEGVNELLQFLRIDQRLDLKAVSLSHVLGLTGGPDGKMLLLNSREIIKTLITLTTDQNKTIAKDAVLSLINLTAEEEGAKKVYEQNKLCTPSIIPLAVDAIAISKTELADPWTMVLCNLTRSEALVDPILDELEAGDHVILRLVKTYCLVSDNKHAKLHYLGPLFCNLTQTAKGRQIFCDKRNFFQRQSHFVYFKDSVIRQGGAIGMLKNICFDPAYHNIIINNHDDALYCLLHPLAGPEEFTDEENEKFPIELQYLNISREPKKRVEDPDLRRMLLESLLQLCATKAYREFMRAKGTYEILREYHKWEATEGGDREALLVCEKVVDILIRKEEEIGIDNIREIEVPEDLTKQFVEVDREFIDDK